MILIIGLVLWVLAVFVDGWVLYLKIIRMLPARFQPPNAGEGSYGHNVFIAGCILSVWAIGMLSIAKWYYGIGGILLGYAAMKLAARLYLGALLTKDALRTAKKVLAARG